MLNVIPYNVRFAYFKYKMRLKTVLMSEIFIGSQKIEGNIAWKQGHWKMNFE